MNNPLSFEVLAYITLSVNSASKISNMSLLWNTEYAKTNLKTAFFNHLRQFVVKIFLRP